MTVTKPDPVDPGAGGGNKPPPGNSGDGDVVDPGAGDGDGDEDLPGDGDGDVEADAGTDAGEGDGGAVLQPWYACQTSDQAFVRRAMMAVLGRRPYSQAEVDVYTDLIGQIDAEDGASNVQAPGTPLRRSRQVFLKALFKDPGYKPFWTELYRDFMRVQRVDETANTACFNATAATDPVRVATFVRGTDPSTVIDTTELGEFTMLDVMQGALDLDDVSPMYVANLFAMVSKTYAGANAEPSALEISRRADFGAWFDATYLNRDVVCLGCHNSEFSVTGSPIPERNRHWPLPGLVEKTLFGTSIGPEVSGVDPADVIHASLRYYGFVNSCSQPQTQQQTYNNQPADAKKPFACGSNPDTLSYRCSALNMPNLNALGRLCEDEYNKLTARPWGWATGCGRYRKPELVLVDVAGVEAKFGNITGLRSSPWQLAESLRKGFSKLRREGLGVDANNEVSDPDKAFAYLVAMRVAENVWLQIVGTPLTIPTRYPRNAAARDQLYHLTETFIKSGFSNQALIEAVLASPYANIAPPAEGCGEAYSMPALFDPWIIAEDDVRKRKNTAGDGIQSMTARTASNALYSALGWKHSIPFPTGNANLYERNFMTETGHFLKNAEGGFRGFDFQARLGWEDRFATCQKLPTVTDPDFIDRLVGAVKPKQATVRDLVVALKDRLIGEASIDEGAEKTALENMLGTSLDTDAAEYADAVAGLRKVCGVLVATPQFVLSGLPPRDGVEVPKLTPESASYSSVCQNLEYALVGAASVECPRDGRLQVTVN